jgi:hypothetical protein
VDDVVYILMEFVDGESLRHRLGAGRLPPAEALRIIPQLCDAVQYAHDRGVIHRDLKPENVLIDRAGNVKVADFGLAKLGDEDGSNLTGTGDRLGTARYMAPEQWAGSAAVDHRTDIYALGLLFYEVLTGELPAVQFTPPSAKAGTDRRLDRVVAKSLREKPADRYQRAAEVKADVDRIARTSRHRPAVFAAVGGVAVLLAVGVVVPVRRDPAPPTSLELAPPPRPAGVVPAAPESEWSAPENLGPDVNSAEDDGSPCVSADGRTLVFHSQRAGGLGLTDLWECRRATPADPFGPAVPLGPAVNTPDHDGEPALSADGLTMVFVSHRPGGHGGADLWQTRRPAVGAAWGDPVNLGPGVNSPRNEQRPSLQADGLTLTYTTGGGAVVARRPGPGRPFGNRAPFGPAEGLTELQFLSVSADGLSAVGNRPMNGRPALWTAARPAADVPFGPPELVLPTAVLGRGYDTSPAFSADKKTIFFTSNRPGGAGQPRPVDDAVGNEREVIPVVRCGGLVGWVKRRFAAPTHHDASAQDGGSARRSAA